MRKYPLTWSAVLAFLVLASCQLPFVLGTRDHAVHLSIQSPLPLGSLVGSGRAYVPGSPQVHVRVQEDSLSGSIVSEGWEPVVSNNGKQQVHLSIPSPTNGRSLAITVSFHDHNDVPILAASLVVNAVSLSGSQDVNLRMEPVLSHPGLVDLDASSASNTPFGLPAHGLVLAKTKIPGSRSGSLRTIAWNNLGSSVGITAFNVQGTPITATMLDSGRKGVAVEVPLSAADQDVYVLFNGSAVAETITIPQGTMRSTLRRVYSVADSYYVNTSALTNAAGEVEVTAKVWGAGGGSYGQSNGGGGGYVSGTFTLLQNGTVNEMLYVVVGQGGDKNGVPPSMIPFAGGAGYMTGNGCSGGGGSAVLIRDGNYFPRLVAGGGGGGGSPGVWGGPGGGSSGGNNGYTTGGTMANANSDGVGFQAPAGGTSGVNAQSSSAAMIGLGGIGGGGNVFCGGGGGYGGGGFPGATYGGTGGGGYVIPAATGKILQSGSQHNPASMADPDYKPGAGTGALTTILKGGDGLVVLYLTW